MKSELLNDIKNNAVEIYTVLDAIVYVESLAKSIRGSDVLDAAYFVASGLVVSCKHGITSEALPGVIGEAETLLRFLDSLKGQYGNCKNISGLFGMALVRATELLNDLEGLQEAL